jgi:hypothetical protein
MHSSFLNELTIEDAAERDGCLACVHLCEKHQLCLGKTFASKHHRHMHILFSRTCKKQEKNVFNNGKFWGCLFA